jgi:urea carboxylase-associated protein 2
MSDSEDILWRETVEPGACWSHVLKRGTALRITDTEGGANVGAIFYNAEFPAERLNLPDTLKAQHIARLTQPYVLYSDMGRVLCSLVADTVGWHDPLGGCSNEVLVKSEYGEADYQEHRNDFHKNAKDSFLIELAKYGLTQRDLSANVNFFSKVQVGEDGSMFFVPSNSKPGDYIELRAEMNVLTILNTCQHPLDPNRRYGPKPVTLTLRRVATPTFDDASRLVRPENGRGFTLTERYFL